MRDFGAFGLALLQTGCGAGWRTTPLVVATDSVSGVPYTLSPACDSCRVVLPRSAVDSVRLGNPTAGFWKSVGLGLGISFATALVICRLERTCQLGD